MKFVKKIFAIVLLLFITISSIGISFYLHHCGCRNTTLFSFEAGYAEPNTTCCCSTEMPVTSKSSCCDEVKTEKCCNDQYFFLLLPLGPEKIASVFKSWDVKIFSSVIPGINLNENLLKRPELVLHSISLPQIISGKLFVFFTHQIKIPFPKS